MASIGLSAYGMTGARLLELAVSADALGFDALWIGEHLLRPVVQTGEHPSTGTVQHHKGPLIDVGTELTDPLVVHAAIAARTERIKLGTAVYLAPLRHPLHTARSTITVQELSGGRLLLGVGAGWQQEEFDAFGIPFRTRISRTEECVEVLRRAWSGEEFGYRGTHFAFDAVQVHPRPVDIPVIMGGNAQAALARAARLGDGWFTSGTPAFDEARRLVAEVHRHREEHGRTGPFTTYVRAPKPDIAELRRYEEHGMADLVLWADAVWHGRTSAERHDNLAAFAERAGLTPVAAPKGGALA
ncbi:TIGR03619 family F420-dependent LLM class oxidoreductase [Nocardia higoensis]|uniref:TIGR03619 family F420-dependent LLM class oxidoreductase n=1 Tax=Nocardia higoensis TaxID=228599 RepID=UPI000593987F|nr:TIGR03619 family F420-dependent LLM class oxidoreductase [Nocardia higoensis]